MQKKGFEKSIHVVITIVVALIVALALITLVTNHLLRTDNQLTPAEQEAACKTWKLVACGPGDIGTKNHPNIEGCEIDCGVE